MISKTSTMSAVLAKLQLKVFLLGFPENLISSLCKNISGQLFLDL